MLCRSMPPSEPSRVFISYARKDGAALAQRLQSDLGKEGFDVWLDTQRLTAGDIWSSEIEQAIDRADVVLALLSAGSFTSDICRAEQGRALDKGKCVVPLRVQSDCDIPLQLQTRQWLDFSNLRLYPEQLPKLVESIEKRVGVVLPAELLISYNNAPGLPQNFVNRPELLEALRNTLFTEGENRNTAITAMQGMGGIGKTVLAQALCHNDVVQQAFPDGIFWFAIGKESQLDFPSRVKGVPGLDRLLGQYESEAACLSQYRDVLRKKAALIVVDDVWRASDVEPFIAESPCSRLLITTRDTSIGAYFGAHEFTAILLTEDESRQVLAKWSGRAAEGLPPQASEVIHECGHLPLALAMIGAQLRAKPPGLWNAVLEHLRKADLQKIKSQFPEPHTTLFRAIQVSVDALDEHARDRYVALAVMPEEMAVAPHVQQCLWGLDENEAAETAEQFVGLSLAQREPPEGSIRLHDLQLDYVRALYPGKESLDLIRGATRLSSHVIAKDPGQFASQMMGRLLPHQNILAIAEFIKRTADGTRAPWLRPLQPTLHPPGTALVRILTGHTSSVDAVAVTPDGQCAVSASWDDTLKVWDLGSGRELRTLTGHTSDVTAVAVTPDGQCAVSASEDKTLKVWELGSGRELRTLTGHTSSVYAVAVTPDGQRAVSASSDHTLKVWELGGGRELRTLTGHTNSVFAVAVTPDGQRAVSASIDQTLKVWELGSGRELRTLTGHTDCVYAVAVTPDGQRAVSASWDQTLKVWELGSGRELRTLTGHTHHVYAVAVTPDGQRAVSASIDHTLKVWELASGRELRTLTGHTSSVYAVAVTPDGQRAVSASSDHTLKVWEVRSGRELPSLTGHTNFVTAVAVTPDGQRALSASSDHTLKVWELGSGRELRTLSGHTSSVTAVAVTPDGQRAVSASWDHTLKVWELGSGRELRTFTGHTNFVTAVAVTPDGQCAVSASWDETLKVWELGSGRELRTFTGHTSSVDAVAVTPDGQRAVSASRDNTLKVWELGSGRELRTFTGHTNFVTAVAVTPDGLRAVSASEDQALKVWELETGKVLATFTCDSLVLSCAFSAAPKLIIAGDAGGHVHFLRLEEPKPKD